MEFFVLFELRFDFFKGSWKKREVEEKKGKKTRAGGHGAKAYGARLHGIK